MPAHGISAPAALMRLGQHEQAMERARRASTIDPEDSAVLYNVGCVYALAGSDARGAGSFGQGDPEWIRPSRTGWRTIRIGIPCATSRDSKRCCESFDAPMPAMQESHLHLEIAHVLFMDVVGYSKAAGQ